MRPRDSRRLPPDRISEVLKNSSGTTLIEVVAVLLLLGIMALVVTSRTTSGTASLIATTDAISSQLRLVQTFAMNGSGGAWGVRFESAGQTYHMFHCTDEDDCDMDRDIVSIPGIETDNDDRIAVSDGDIQLLTNTNVAYDSVGRPCQITGSSVVPTNNTIDISFQDGNGNTHEIQVTPKTGFIP